MPLTAALLLLQISNSPIVDIDGSCRRLHSLGHWIGLEMVGNQMVGTRVAQRQLNLQYYSDGDYDPNWRA